MAVEALSHMCMLDFGHVIGQCMGSIPMRKPWLGVVEMDMVGIALLDVCLRGLDWRGS